MITNLMMVMMMAMMIVVAINHVIVDDYDVYDDDESFSTAVLDEVSPKITYSKASLTDLDEIFRWSYIQIGKPSACVGF